MLIQILVNLVNVETLHNCSDAFILKQIEFIAYEYLYLQENLINHIANNLIIYKFSYRISSMQNSQEKIYNSMKQHGYVDYKTTAFLL